MRKNEGQGMNLPKAIFFDLDGTLADTALDLAAALNQVRQNQGLSPVPESLLRPVASAGARGLIGVAYGLSPDDAGFEEIRVAFLEQYANKLVEHTGLFEGVVPLLSSLTSASIVWGVVTNKPERFAKPLVQQIGLEKTACVIGGDTTPYAKPHPEPLLMAARCCGVLPEECWYVGDDLRDIQAAHAAGMVAVAAGWGYAPYEEVVQWGAEWVANMPMDIHICLGLK
jgi:phosphoglycolate phosphatase